MNIRDKFGTAWIGNPGSAGLTAATPEPRIPAVNLPAPNEAPAVTVFPVPVPPAAVYRTLGKQILKLLEESNGVDRVYALADKMKLEPQDLEAPVEWMARNYYIRVEADRFGNHEIRATEKAKEITD